MTNKLMTTMLTLPVLAGVLTAQAPKSQALLMALGANAKQMAPYRWKQKVTVVRKGAPQEPIIEEVRIDNGQVRRTTLAKPDEKKMGPLRARKVAEVKESVQEVMQLAGRYSSPQQLSEAMQKGELWEGRGTLRVQARSLVLPMDEVTLVVNGNTFLTTRLDCKTRHDGGNVVIAVDYEQIPGGPSVMTRMTVQIPKDDIVVHVDSYDYVRLAGNSL